MALGNAVELGGAEPGNLPQDKDFMKGKDVRIAQPGKARCEAATESGSYARLSNMDVLDRVSVLLFSLILSKDNCGKSR